MEISVIMLTYNREHFISGMIEDILGQTFTDYEFIIVDNGSTDRSGDIADDYARKDSRIRVIHRERGNIGSGRNTGLDIAQGSYIAFVDDDDHCTLDYLEFLHALVIENCADASICGATWANSDEKSVMSPEEAIVTLLWRKKYNVAFPTKMFKKELFLKTRFPETGKYDDIYLMPQMLAKAERVAYHGLSKYHFNRHESNNSAWTQNHKLLDAETLQEYLDVYNDRTVWLTAKFPDRSSLWQYFNWSFMISMVEKIRHFDITGCDCQLEYMKQMLRENRKAFLAMSEILPFEKEWLQNFIPE